MLRNYFKIFLKISRESKLYTSLGLFGVSITIMFVMIVMMTLDNVANGNGPEKDTDKILYAWRMIVRSTVKGENGMSSSSLSSQLFEDYLAKSKEAELVSLKSSTTWEFIFQGNRYQKVVMQTDGNFWKMFNCTFIEGRPFLSSEIDDGLNYCVINRSFMELLFQGESQVIGKTIEYQGMDLTIIGIIEDIPPAATNSNADIFIPYNIIPQRITSPYLGFYTVMFSSKTRKQNKRIVKEIREIIGKLDAADEKVSLLVPGPGSQLEKMLIGYSDPQEYKGSTPLLLLFFGKIIAFLLLPAINLMALNYSRIRERTEEIGVRKAFGAGRRRIRNQFIFESVFITLIGGVLGIILSYFVVLFFASSIRIPISPWQSVPIDFSFNPQVFLFSLVSCLIFSLVSGVLPAITMSKMKPAIILKGGEL